MAIELGSKWVYRNKGSHVVEVIGFHQTFDWNEQPIVQVVKGSLAGSVKEGQVRHEIVTADGLRISGYRRAD